MKGIKWIVFFMVLMLLMTFTLIATIAASPSVNPEKGPPDFNKIVFVHYPKGMAPGKPSGTPGKGPQENGYIYSGYHWADEAIPVNYYINPSGSSGDPTFIPGIQAGFQVWEDEPSSYMDFNYGGVTDSVISSLNDVMDGENVVGWANISGIYPNAIATTQFWYNILTKEIAEIDLALNSDPYFLWCQNTPGDEVWDYADTSQYDVDVQNIIAHEAGHWLVLDDLYADNNMDKTMYGYSDQMELIKRSLAPGDVAGIQAIYPQTTSGQGVMHVGNINMRYSASGSNYFIYTEVTVLDENAVAVPAATVYIDTLLSDGSTGSSNGETNTQGVATFKLKSKQEGTYTSTVTNVNKDGWAYNLAANLETTDSLQVP
ncbi:MAG: hypothetical protein M1479_10025 [Actinobacteria bacterium]|nr:hypothetical protein [Actinomycetota bacterium]